MPNHFFVDYQKLSTSIFTGQTYITQRGSDYQRNYQILKVDLSEAMIQHALNIAEEKSKYTMDANQAEVLRTPLEKQLSAFRGILAETASQILLERCLKSDPVSIKRYDLERASFEYNPEEYDIKIEHHNGTYKIESRSSENYKHSLTEGLEKFDIIGRYTNNKKKVEAPSDFYIRPLYHYDPTLGAQEKNLANYIDKLRNGKIILYLTAGTDQETMERYQKIKPMGQNNTQFRCLWMQHYKAKDIMQFISQIQNAFQ